MISRRFGLCVQRPGGGGVLPSTVPLDVMGSHFRGWIDYNGIVFSLE